MIDGAREPDGEPFGLESARAAEMVEEECQAVCVPWVDFAALWRLVFEEFALEAD